MFNAVVILTLVVSMVGCYEVDDTQGLAIIQDNFVIAPGSIEFGSGYSSVKLQRTFNSAVEVDVPTDDLSAASTTYRIQLCKTRSQFLEMFSSKLSTPRIYMGVEYGSDLAKFVDKTETAFLDTIVVATVEVVTKKQSVGNTRLTGTSKGLLESAKYDVFVETYGTHYLQTVTLGGTMIIVTKFTSTSVEEKNSLDKKLEAISGSFSSKGELSTKMRSLEEGFVLSSIFTSGGDGDVPTYDIESCIKFISTFTNSIPTNYAVVGVEFAALWNVPGVPTEFTEYLFPIQDVTDQVVRISANLLNVQSRIESVLALRNSDLTYITSKSWKTIENLGKEAASLRRDIQRKFKTLPSNEYKEIVNQVEGRATLMEKKLDKILNYQKSYRYPDKMYLKSVGTNKFISTETDETIRLDALSPITLKMQDVSGRTTRVNMGQNDFIHIRSVAHPRNVLCMSSVHRYARWRNTPNTKQCQWRIEETEGSQDALDYGDRVIIYNRFWRSWILGTSSDGKWLKSVRAKYRSDEMHHWFVDNAE